MPSLFDPLTIRNLTLRNRIGISPMCMYSADDGVPNDWHLVHLGSRAAGGSGLIIAEATGVEARGRISFGDSGLWNDKQTAGWARIVHFVKSQGAAIGVQLAHAGRKASTDLPWTGGKPIGLNDQRGWTPIGPSAIPFDDRHTTPTEMTTAMIDDVVNAFVASAKRAVEAGFDLIEIHAAHGYLLHSFYSPLSNQRADAFGSSFDNRVRLVLTIAERIRAVIPDGMPLFTRLSCSDWTPGGWTIEDSVELSKRLKARGVDLIDASSGGNVATAKIPVGPGYQVPFARQIRKEADIATAAVGMITEPAQADALIRDGDADLVLIARESLRDPNFAIRSAKALGVDVNSLVPPQYARSW